MLQISKKYFATFDIFFVKTKLVTTVWVSTSLSDYGYCEPDANPSTSGGSYRKDSARLAVYLAALMRAQ